MKEVEFGLHQIENSQDNFKKSEFSFLLVKPNATKAGLIGILRQELVKNGFDIIGEQKIRISRRAGNIFYSSLGEKKKAVIDHIVSGDSYVFMVYGPEVIKKLREFQGHTEWKDRPAKGLRGRYGFDHVQNSVHCPDSHAEAVTELEEVFTDLKDKMLKSQLADELFEFLFDKESINNGERYLSTYAV